jgi:flagellar basal body rod protein FlgG
MVDMIQSQRAYQLASKAISTADQMMQVANQVKA